MGSLVTLFRHLKFLFDRFTKLCCIFSKIMQMMSYGISLKFATLIKVANVVDTMVA